MSTKPQHYQDKPQVAPGPLKWSRSPDGITVEQISGDTFTGKWYAQQTFDGLMRSTAASSDDINDVLKPELMIINAHPTPEQRELAAVRFRHFLMDSLNDYKGRVNFFGVTGIQVLTDPARVVFTSDPEQEPMTVRIMHRVESPHEKLWDDINRKVLR